MVPPEDGKCLIYSLVLDRGSLGPSTVTLMALVYVATWGGVVDTVMVMLKLFPENTSGDTSLLNRKIRIEVEGRRYFRVSPPPPLQFPLPQIEEDHRFTTDRVSGENSEDSRRMNFVRHRP